MSERPAVDSLDEARLRAYLEAQLPGFRGPLRASKFQNGQSNPTFRLDTAERSWVLRRQPPGKLLKSAHAVDREFRVMRALAGSAVPVPRVHHLCEDREVIGSLFFVMEYCAGRVFQDAALPELDRAARGEVYAEMGRVLAALHGLDFAALGLADFGRPGNYYARQLERWTVQYRDSETRRIPDMDALIDWLAAALPEDDGRAALVHGDYRLDNIMFHPSEQRAIAVLDWELSTLGHPFADLAYQCMQWRLPAGDRLLAGLQGLDRKALGIPSDAEYVAAYCEAMGIGPIRNWSFYLAFAFFRLAAIIQGVARRALDGNASNRNAAQLGAAVEPLAVMAMRLVEEES